MPGCIQHDSAHSRAGLRPCWSCRGPVGGEESFCPTCHAIQPPAPVDAFARFSLSPSFNIEKNILERIYLDLQRRFHPDCFATKSPKERAVAQMCAAALNESYEILRDPVRRAECLLARAGRAAEGGDGKSISDPTLLAESLELREELADADDLATLESLAHRTQDMKETCLRDIAAAFALNDFKAASRMVTRLKYILKFESELRHSTSRFVAGA